MGRRAAPLLPLVALAALCWPALAPSAQLYFRDTGRLYAPVKLHIASRLLRGELPLWDPWTEAGTSLLGQVTPGLFHPFTLLYAALPFELAFKLNHLLALPLAALGLWLLARRLGASPWAAAVGAVAYGGCGFLVSMAASNLPFALGAAQMPLALWGLLRFLQQPAPAALLLSSALLALCALGGDPQSMLLTCFVGGVAGVLLAAPRGPRPTARAAGLVVLWGACGLLLSAPASLPAWKSLQRSERAGGVSPGDRDRFSLSPRRLPGLVVPLAFDDTGERSAGSWQRTRYQEFFAGSGEQTPFSASIAVGAPALLLALFAAGRRRGALLLCGALLLLGAALGECLPLLGLMRAAIPGFSLFRFAEKLVGPASLLLCAAAALGADAALLGDARITRRLVAAAGILALLALGLGLWAQRAPPSLLAAVAAQGETQQTRLAAQLLGSLGAGLVLAGGLWLALALAGALRLRKPTEAAALLAALACAASVLLSAPSTLPVAPLELLRAPPILARELFERAGPSEGRWRLFTQISAVPISRLPDVRLARELWAYQALQPQFEALTRIEGVRPYFSALDVEYATALIQHPSRMFPFLNVRFVLFPPGDYTPEQAHAKGFRPTHFGFWLRELPPSPRAFLADGAGEAELRSPRPELQRVEVRADREALLVVSTHFDPGWRATLDGAPCATERVEHAVLGVRVPAGRHRVELRFFPDGLWAGLWTMSAALVALLLACAVKWPKQIFVLLVLFVVCLGM